MDLPKIRISPEVGVIRPRIIWIVVVLPAPLGPSIPTISPRSIRNDTPSTAVKVSKRLVRFSTWTNIVGFLSTLARAHSVAEKDGDRRIHSLWTRGRRTMTDVCCYLMRRRRAQRACTGFSRVDVKGTHAFALRLRKTRIT